MRRDVTLVPVQIEISFEILPSLDEGKKLYLRDPYAR